MTPSLPRRLTLADRDRAAEVMSAAFADDPLQVALIPDPARRRALQPLLYRAVVGLGIRSGGAYGVGEPLAGFATWSWPGQPRPPLSAFTRAGFGRLLLSPWLTIIPRAIPLFNRFDDLRKKHAPGPHYYLNTIGVAPQAQGQGLASRLIRPFLDEADCRGLPAYTETVTPANVALYEHYGFRVVEEAREPTLGLTLWGFYRPPP